MYFVHSRSNRRIGLQRFVHLFSVAFPTPPTHSRNNVMRGHTRMHARCPKSERHQYAYSTAVVVHLYLASGTGTSLLSILLSALVRPYYIGLLVYILEVSYIHEHEATQQYSSAIHTAVQQ